MEIQRLLPLQLLVRTTARAEGASALTPVRDSKIAPPQILALSRIERDGVHLPDTRFTSTLPDVIARFSAAVRALASLWAKSRCRMLRT